MTKTVDLARLADMLRGYRFAYLVSVDDDFRAHTTTVTPAFASGVLDIGPVGRHSRANLVAHPEVTLVWPPREVDDYSLIVDGFAALADTAADSVRVTPRRALLHRPVLSADGQRAAGGVYDCVQLTES